MCVYVCVHAFVCVRVRVLVVGWVGGCACVYIYRAYLGLFVCLFVCLFVQAALDEGKSIGPCSHPAFAVGTHGVPTGYPRGTHRVLTGYLRGTHGVLKRFY